MILSDNEKRVLSVLKKVKKSSIEEIVKETGVNKDGVRRSSYFLSEKGLAKIRVEKREGYRLSEKGRELLRKGFKEENVESIEGKSIGELDDYFKSRIWLLKESGLIDIEKGVVKRGEGGEYVLRKAMEKVERGEEVKDKKVLKFLEKEGLVERFKEERVEVEITEKGEEYREGEEGEIVKLSREVILSGEWKRKRFRKFNIKKVKERYEGGKLHPLSIAMRKIKNVFLSLGFREMKGNYVEDSFWVFDALFQPQDHPSRELADTFYIEGRAKEDLEKDLVERVKKVHEEKWKYKWSFEEARRLVLRTHTTALSSKTLYKEKEGKYFAIGRVFRNEAVDYKHLAEFHQIEGIVAWEKANFRNLMWLLKEFYKRLGFEKIRFRPSYFPYTEPSMEVETYFEEKGEWIEIAGAGIFRREVVEPLGAKYPVLAWGLSLERPLMIMLGIEDIREFYTNRKKWLESIPYKKIFK